MEQLPNVACRHRFVDAEVFWYPVARHVVRAKKDVPHGKQPGEVPVDRGRIARMMPAVEHRRGDHAPQRSEVPVHVGMEQDGVERQHRCRGRRDHRIEAEQQHRHRPAEIAYEFVHRMHADARHPVEMLRAVMHRVKRPPSSAVKHAVVPIGEEVDEQIDLDGLQPKGLPREGPEARIGPRAKLLHRGDATGHEYADRQHDEHANERLRDERREDPVRGVGEKSLPHHRPATTVAEQPFDHKEDRGEHDQAEHEPRWAWRGVDGEHGQAGSV